MLSLHRNGIVAYLAIMVVALAWFYQGSIYYDSDNSILLHEAARLWQGGSYTQQFFETSPPMILYLYLPVVWLAKWVSLPLYLLFRAYVFAITLICLGLCYRLSDVLFHLQDKLIQSLFFLSLLAILLIFPNHELGQREDLYFVMCLPYCFLVARHLNGGSAGLALKVVIGVLAGIAFSIKPFFVLTPIMLEIWVMLSEQRFFAFFRPEAMAAFFTMLVYALISVWLNADYYHTIIPYAMHTYYAGLAFSLPAMIFYPISVYCYLPIVLYAIFYQQFTGYHRFINTLCVAALSFTLVYIVQRLPYYYHAVPGFLMAVSLFELLISFFVFRFKEIQLDGWLLASFITITVFFEFCYRESLWGVLAISPVLPWLYYFTVLTVLYCLYEQSLQWRRWVLAMSVIFGVAILSAYLFPLAFPAYKTIFQTRFTLIMVVLFGLFILAFKHPTIAKSKLLGLSLMVAMCFDYPTLIVATIYERAVTYQKNTRPLLAYMNQHFSNKTLYLFSSRGNTVFPLIDYADVKVTSVSRFPFFWMMPGLVKQLNTDPKGAYLKNRDYLINAITADLITNKPDYVFVDVSNKKGNLLYPFEYLPYFSKNPAFVKAWQPYEYVTRLDGQPLRFDYTYHVAVYRRHLTS
ncbi:MAG TPA: hypothetical protein VFU82_00090 [Gammaproteobacteria bacterium]|nr:hypothetical protein [Gammaproteobacteria bacterium]